MPRFKFVTSSKSATHMDTTLNPVVPRDGLFAGFDLTNASDVCRIALGIIAINKPNMHAFPTLHENPKRASEQKRTIEYLASKARNNDLVRDIFAKTLLHISPWAPAKEFEIAGRSLSLYMVRAAMDTTAEDFWDAERAWLRREPLRQDLFTLKPQHHQNTTKASFLNTNGLRQGESEMEYALRVSKEEYDQKQEAEQLELAMKISRGEITTPSPPRYRNSFIKSALAISTLEGVEELTNNKDKQTIKRNSSVDYLSRSSVTTRRLRPILPRPVDRAEPKLLPWLVSEKAVVLALLQEQLKHYRSPKLAILTNDYNSWMNDSEVEQDAGELKINGQPLGHSRLAPWRSQINIHAAVNGWRECQELIVSTQMRVDASTKSLVGPLGGVEGADEDKTKDEDETLDENKTEAEEESRPPTKTGVLKTDEATSSGQNSNLSTQTAMTGLKRRADDSGGDEDAALELGVPEPKRRASSPSESASPNPTPPTDDD